MKKTAMFQLIYQQQYLTGYNHYCGSLRQTKNYAISVDRTQDLQIFSLTLSQLS